jgi:Prophage minor tail protein Z (GPZ)
MSVQFTADSADFARLSRAIGRLPSEIRHRAFASAMRRVGDTARSRIVKRNAERIDVAQKVVREKTRVFTLGDSAEISVKSGQLSLAKLGGRETARGVSVPLRGSYKSAFIAAMASGHEGVMKRTGASRLPIHELYGPNPASDIVRHEPVYQQVLGEVADTVLIPRLLHELSRLLPK